jgi:alkanesulfonate monooxygenase SsuD/methylene tetrahydromethanopterin reductase-like flavin-dependent oxidoreductase (luciferase family)
VPLAEARARTDEAIAVLRAAWSGEPIVHDGRFWRFDGVRVQPRPRQRPHPPLWYASVNPDSVAHYAALGIPFLVDSTVRTSKLAELADTWRGIARANGHDAGAELAAVRYVWLDDDDDAARQHVARAPRVTTTETGTDIRPVEADGRIAEGYEYWAKGWHGRDLAYYGHEDDWGDRWVAGGPERVIAQLRALADMGIGDVCCVFGLEPRPVPVEEARRRMARFAREVMPALRG